MYKSTVYYYNAVRVPTLGTRNEVRHSWCTRVLHPKTPVTQHTVIT